MVFVHDGDGGGAKPDKKVKMLYRRRRRANHHRLSQRSSASSGYDRLRRIASYRCRTLTNSARLDQRWCAPEFAVRFMFSFQFSRFIPKCRMRNMHWGTYNGSGDDVASPIV